MRRRPTSTQKGSRSMKEFSTSLLYKCFSFSIFLPSWRGAFIIISGICLNTLVLDLVLTSYVSGPGPERNRTLTSSPDAVNLLSCNSETPMCGRLESEDHNLLSRDSEFPVGGRLESQDIKSPIIDNSSGRELNLNLEGHGCCDNKELDKDLKSSRPYDDTMDPELNLNRQDSCRIDKELGILTLGSDVIIPNGDIEREDKFDASLSNLLSDFETQKEQLKTYTSKTEIYPYVDPCPQTLEDGSNLLTSRESSSDLRLTDVNYSCIEQEHLKSAETNIDVEPNNRNDYDLQIRQLDRTSEQPKEDHGLENKSKVDPADIKLEHIDIPTPCVSISHHPLAELNQNKLIVDPTDIMQKSVDTLTPGVSISTVSLDLADLNQNKLKVDPKDIEVEPVDIPTPCVSISHVSLDLTELKQSHWKFLLDPLTWTILAFLGLTLGGVFSTRMLVMDIADNKGFPQHGLVLILVGMFSGLVAKAASGVFGLCRKLPSFLLLAASGFLGSAGLAMIGWVESLEALVASMSLLGSSTGFITSVFPKCFLDMSSVGPVAYPLALGMGNTVEGIFDFLFPVLIGHMVDVTDTYTLPCSILSTIAFVCSCALAVVYLRTKE